MKKIIPNCFLCLWHEAKNVTLYNQKAEAHFCSAQGYGSCSDCYNNRRCKKLYEPFDEGENK